MGLNINRDEALLAGYQRLRQFARFAIGRILGTVSHTNGACKYFVDLGESKLFHRAELNAITRVLIEKKIVTPEEWAKMLDQELTQAVEDQKDIWPEVTPAADGGSFVLDVAKWKERVKAEGWPP